MWNALCLTLALMPVAASASLPNEGVAYQVKRGFFAETDVGALMSLGGRDGYSNTESFVQLGLGVDIGSRFEVGALFGLGASNVNCFAQGSATSASCTGADSFTLGMLDGFVGFLVPLNERLHLTPKLLAGYTSLQPNPLTLSGKTVYSAPNVGAAFGIEYATSLPHFSIGAEVALRYVLQVRVPTLALFPRIKYTF